MEYREIKIKTNTKTKTRRVLAIIFCTRKIIKIFKRSTLQEGKFCQEDNGDVHFSPEVIIFEKITKKKYVFCFNFFETG